MRSKYSAVSTGALGFIVAFLTLILFAATARAADPPKVVAIESVAWLQGCWELSSAERTVEEQWMAPRGGVMLGIGRTVRGQRLIDSEYVVLRQSSTGLDCEAHPQGQTPAVFSATEVSATKVVFENSQHDFPPAVGYALSSRNELLAWIEGTIDGNKKRIEFPYKRVKCGGE